MPGALTGGCLCGAVRFSAAGGMRGVNHCHCESCRRATSSPFTTWFTVRAADLAWTGRPQDFASSPGVTRRFCPRCGSPLSYETADRPGEVDLYAASLDDSSGVAPEFHSFWAERIPWVTLADDLPRE